MQRDDKRYVLNKQSCSRKEREQQNQIARKKVKQKIGFQRLTVGINFDIVPPSRRQRESDVGKKESILCTLATVGTKNKLMDAAMFFFVYDWIWKPITCQ
jgi:hypothetical protein